MITFCSIHILCGLNAKQLRKIDGEFGDLWLEKFSMVKSEGPERLSGNKDMQCQYLLIDIFATTRYCPFQMCSVSLSTIQR